MLNMTVQEAKRINDLLVQGWMVREKLTRDAIPSLHTVSLAEAVRASEIMAVQPPTEWADGSMTFHCFVDPTIVPRLYAWIIMQSQMD